jgi:hypothetical protein
MLVELFIRFALGGAVVSAFAAVGEVLRPKTFAGIFGAAPSVALASLALAFEKHGADYVADDARSMLIGAVGLYVYGAACVAGTKDERWPVWLAAIASWTGWFGVAIGIWGAGRARGGRRQRGQRDVEAACGPVEPTASRPPGSLRPGRGPVWHALLPWRRRFQRALRAPDR